MISWLMITVTCINTKHKVKLFNDNGYFSYKVLLNVIQPNITQIQMYQLYMYLRQHLASNNCIPPFPSVYFLAQLSTQ